MPDWLRPAVYPVLLICIIGSLWLLGQASSEADRDTTAKFSTPIVRTTDPATDDARTPDESRPTTRVATIDEN